MSAKDLGTGKEQKITITASTNLSEDEIERAIKEAEQFAEQDKKKKEAIDTKNEADSLVFQTEKTLKELGDKIEAADKTKIEDELKKVKELLQKFDTENINESQVAELKKAKESLTNIFYEISAKLYQQQGPQGGANASSGPEKKNDGPDDVVDADYKEI